MEKVSLDIIYFRYFLFSWQSIVGSFQCQRHLGWKASCFGIQFFIVVSINHMIVVNNNTHNYTIHIFLWIF